MRKNKLIQIRNQNDWNNYSQRFRENFFRQFVGLDTPPNAIVTGKLERDSFTLEKIIFESQPGLFVSGSMFIPKYGEIKHPAILVCNGHSQDAFRQHNYQSRIINLVKNGFVVFTYDPIGQGERVQNLDKQNDIWQIKGSTHEHSYVGGQCLLAGYSINDYFIWDGIRAIDYIVSRPEVDATRIGMTGISGGGAQTAFLSAFDERIVASAPECYITSFQRIFESVGPQDGEQNPYHGVKRGFEHADLIISRAPKATMIVSATEDFFSIQGARETYNEVKKVYQFTDYPDHISMVEAIGTHGFQRDNNESLCRFFRTYLNLPGYCIDQGVNCFSKEELQVSTTGQLSTSYNSKTIFDLNKEKARRLIQNREYTTSEEIAENRDYYMGKMYELSGYDSSRIITSVVYTGSIEKKGYKIEKYFIQGSRFEYPIPFLFIKPVDGGKRPVILYLDPMGKENFLHSSGEIERYIDMGYSIVVPDLIGMGELDYIRGVGDSYIRGVSYNIWFGANLVGTSIAGIQASDLRLIYQYLNTCKDVDFDHITSVVKDELCSSYLHFAIFNLPVEHSILVNPLVSYEDILLRKYYEPRYLWTAVPGAVLSYDIPQMLTLLSPNKLTIIKPVNSAGETVDPLTVSQNLDVVQAEYIHDQSAEKLNIISNGEGKPEDILMELLEHGIEF
ncbi:MAG: acetylxylan esterase [Bacteroidota bacterium]